jgi:hypothetical protein
MTNFSMRIARIGFDFFSPASAAAACRSERGEDEAAEVEVGRAASERQHSNEGTAG